MKYTETAEGRVFVLRLEDGETVQEQIENFAMKKEIHSAKVRMIGVADKGSKLIVGPKQGRSSKIVPVVITLDEMHEAVGIGTIFRNEQGIPKLHCHPVCGRKNTTLCGEIREGVIVSHIMEVIITELVDCKATRKPDTQTGFELLQPEM
ncbi:MAG: DNA-binding protein [Bacteroidales bacterium]|nr:DNA-binding protein [Bacteroidales bacterium]